MANGDELTRWCEIYGHVWKDWLPKGLNCGPGVFNVSKKCDYCGHIDAKVLVEVDCKPPFSGKRLKFEDLTAY